MKNLLGAGRGRADRPEKKGAITINKQMREKIHGSNHCSVVVVVGKEEEEEEEEKEENSQVLFSSGGPCGLGYSSAGLVTIGTMVL